VIEQVLALGNLSRAYGKVYDNHGASGIDKISVEELGDLLRQNIGVYQASIRNGSYLVSAIKGVKIPKTNGKTRLLGIPTVLDRLFQQALHQVLEVVFEPKFQNHSYGFRPNRSAHQSLLQSQNYINSGYQDIVDIDLKSFFDEVNHDILLSLIYKEVKCKATLKLIRSFMRAPIELDGKLTKRRKGVPQGGPLSPLLSNILLNELDKELEYRCLRYVRYADDFSVYVRSKKAAKRVGNSIYKYLRDFLKLPINREKSGVRRPSTFSLLGYSYVPQYKKGSKGQYQFVVAKSRWKTLKQKLKQISKKTLPLSFDERIKRYKWLIRGWLNYFKLASIQVKLKQLDEWFRNRLRYCIWTDWKKPERKRKNLIRLGVKTGIAYAWSRTRMGGWRVAQSPILVTTITIKRLIQRGYLSMLNYYHKIKHQ
jgi:RNA-directed DNA polymerase